MKYCHSTCGISWLQAKNKNSVPNVLSRPSYRSFFLTKAKHEVEWLRRSKR
jgi:hypothetical protein